MLNLKDVALLRQRVYVGGKWLPARSGQTLQILDPASGQRIGSVPSCDEQDVRTAIHAAQAALAAWSAMSAHVRAALLRKWHDLMLEHADDLALLMTLEQGKPLAEAKAEILYGASFVRSSSGLRRKASAPMARRYRRRNRDVAF